MPQLYLNWLDPLCSRAEQCVGGLGERSTHHGQGARPMGPNGSIPGLANGECMVWFIGLVYSGAHWRTGECHFPPNKRGGLGVEERQKDPKGG